MGKIVLFTAILFTACSTEPSATRAIAQPLPPIFVDHVFVMLDEASYKALGEATWLEKQGYSFNEFNKSVSTWHGHYIQGTQGYLEIFSAKEMAGHAYIKQPSAIGFYTEQVGSLDQIHAVLQKSRSAQPAFEIYENFFSRQSYLGLPNLATWVMEAKPGFFKSDNIRRETWSNFFRSKAKFQGRPAISKIRSIHIDMSRPERERMAQSMSAIGYHESAPGTWTGPETTIVIGEKVPYGIKKVSFEVDGSKLNDAIDRKLGLTQIEKKKGALEISFTFAPETPAAKK